MSNAVSLTRFLSVRFISAAIVICVLWYFVTRDLYWLALDGTSAFYLFEDGHQAWQAQQSDIDVSSLNTPFKQFFTEFENLPALIQQQLEKEGLPDNRVSLIFSGAQDIYLLPYREASSAPVIYVMHRFDKQLTQDISPVLLLLSFSVLSLMFGLMWFVITRLQQQSRKLTNALITIENDQSEQKIDFDIEEFQAIYQEVQSAYRQRYQVLQREKQYSAYLSHEIRHSLAAVNAQLEKLDQIDGFPLAALSPMDEAKKHNMELQRIANAILALWQTDRLTTASIIVAEELASVASRADLGSLELLWRIESPDYEIQCDRDLFHLLVRQLLQNARQYGKSRLILTVHDGELKLSNDVVGISSASRSNVTEYGHQVGMHLIEKICDTMGWQLQVKQGSTFTVTVRF